MSNRVVSEIIIALLLTSVLFFIPSIHVVNATSPSDMAVTNIISYIRWDKFIIMRTIFPPPPFSFSIYINVTVQNQGDEAEAFNVTAYLNTTVVDTQANVTLAPGSSTTLTFWLDSAELAKGKYIISAYVPPLPDETDIADNTLVDGWIRITIPGDVNGDGRVDLRDIFTVGKAYGSVIGDPRYNPNADINGDGKIDLKDYFIVCQNFGVIPQIDTRSSMT
jgi:hypothetical protein